MRQYRTESEAETIALGRRIAVELPPRAVILLIGDLGAGKTTLAKGIVAGLGAAAEEDVSSPTFTLIHEYDERTYHLDLYRLDARREIESLGLDDLLARDDARLLVEWGERFPDFWPEDRIEVQLAADGDVRTITVTGLSDTPAADPRFARADYEPVRKSVVSSGVMIERVTNIPGTPTPRGPYSPAVRAGDFIFVSGQGPIDPATDQLSNGDIKHETRLVLAAIGRILAACGASPADVVKCSVFLSDGKDFAAMNEVYSEFFGDTRPARTTVEAKFVANMKVEIDCVAYAPVTKS